MIVFMLLYTLNSWPGCQLSEFSLLYLLVHLTLELQKYASPPGFGPVVCSRDWNLCPHTWMANTIWNEPYLQPAPFESFMFWHLLKFFLFFMCVSCLHLHVCSDNRIQTETKDHMQRKLQTFVSCHVGAGNCTTVL